MPAGKARVEMEQRGPAKEVVARFRTRIPAAARGCITPAGSAPGARGRFQLLGLLELGFRQIKSPQLKLRA
jgi:hypothetical protein